MKTYEQKLIGNSAAAVKKWLAEKGLLSITHLTVNFDCADGVLGCQHVQVHCDTPVVMSVIVGAVGDEELVKALESENPGPARGYYWVKYTW